jgi:hypothetical protein
MNRSITTRHHAAITAASHGHHRAVMARGTKRARSRSPLGRVQVGFKKEGWEPDRSDQIDINARTPSTCMFSPRPRWTISPRFITMY